MREDYPQRVVPPPPTIGHSASKGPADGGHPNRFNEEELP